MKRLLWIFVLLAFCFFTQIVKAEDDAVLMWERQISGVSDIEFSPTNPDIFALARKDYFSDVQDVLIMSVQTGDTIAQLPTVNNFIISLEFSPDGEKLAVSVEKGIVQIFATSTFNEIARIDLTEGIDVEKKHGAADMEFTSDGMYLITSGNYLNVINTSDWTVKQRWNEIYFDDPPPPDAKSLSRASFLSIRCDNKIVACIFAPKPWVILYDIEQNQPIDTLPCSGGKVEYFNNSNKLILNNGKLHFYNFEVSQEPQIVPVYYFYSKLTDDDSFLYLCGDGEYLLYNTSKWEKLNSFNAYTLPTGLFTIKNNSYLLTEFIKMYDISGLTSVTPEKENSIEISPNPANDEIRIIGLPLDIKTIEIANLKGDIVERIKAKHISDELTYNVSHLPPGAYLLRINTRNDSLSVKFMIER